MCQVCVCVYVVCCVESVCCVSAVLCVYVCMWCDRYVCVVIVVSGRLELEMHLKCLHGGVLGTADVSVGDVGTLRGYHCGAILLNSITRCGGGPQEEKRLRAKVMNALNGPEAGDLEALQRASRAIGVMNLLAGGGSSGRRSRYSVAEAANYSVASRSSTM